MKIAASELIINGDGSIFHLHIRPGQLADKVILVGDPGRIPYMKGWFDEVECEGASREFVWATGIYKGARMTFISTGIGASNIDIVMTELDALANIDFETREVKPEHRTLSIIRLGTCGALHPEIPLGGFLLSKVSIGFDAMLNWYAGRDSFADLAAEEAFKEWMSWPALLPSPYFVKGSEKLAALLESETIPGVTISSPGFYGPQGRSVRLSPSIDRMLEKIESFRWEGSKITNFEMEGAPIAGFARLLGHEAITVCCVIAHRYLKSVNTDYQPRIREMMTLVLDKFATL